MKALAWYSARCDEHPPAVPATSARMSDLHWSGERLYTRLSAFLKPIGSALGIKWGKAGKTAEGGESRRYLENGR